MSDVDQDNEWPAILTTKPKERRMARELLATLRDSQTTEDQLAAALSHSGIKSTSYFDCIEHIDSILEWLNGEPPAESDERVP